MLPPAGGGVGAWCTPVLVPLGRWRSGPLQAGSPLFLWSFALSSRFPFVRSPCSGPTLPRPWAVWCVSPPVSGAFACTVLRLVVLGRAQAVVRCTRMRFFDRVVSCSLLDGGLSGPRPRSRAYALRDPMPLDGLCPCRVRWFQGASFPEPPECSPALCRREGQKLFCRPVRLHLRWLLPPPQASLSLCSAGTGIRCHP